MILLLSDSKNKNLVSLITYSNSQKLHSLHNRPNNPVLPTLQHLSPSITHLDQSRYHYHHFAPSSSSVSRARRRRFPVIPQARRLREQPNGKIDRRVDNVREMVNALGLGMLGPRPGRKGACECSGCFFGGARLLRVCGGAGPAKGEDVGAQVGGQLAPSGQGEACIYNSRRERDRQDLL